MLVELITFIISLGTNNHDAEALRKTAPRYLTVNTAAEHVVAARAAGLLTGTDPDLLLSIAHHESRYIFKSITKEVNGVSCGVMTPEPIKDREACNRATSTIFHGYLAGAVHLRKWLDKCKQDLTCALSGYAGGWRYMRNCRTNPEQYRRQCAAPSVFMGRARMIRLSRTIERRAASTI